LKPIKVLCCKIFDGFERVLSFDHTNIGVMANFTFDIIILNACHEMYDIPFERAIVLHVTTKRRPMLQQMREGLEVYNLIKVMQTKPNECRNLFVVGDDDKVCCNSALGIFLIFCHLMA
jgi:hypothetical protein